MHTRESDLATMAVRIAADDVNAFRELFDRVPWSIERLRCTKTGQEGVLCCAVKV